MSSEEKRFNKLKLSLIQSINKLKKSEFDGIINNVRKVVNTNPAVIKSFSKILKSNKSKSIEFSKRKGIEFSKRKGIKMGGGRELSKEKSEEALRDMIVIGVFCILYLGVQIYNYLTRFKVANITSVKKTFKRNRDKRKDPLSPKPKRRVFRSNEGRRNSDPFSN